MRTLFILLLALGAACAHYRGTPPPELSSGEFELRPYCCNVVENVMAELKERVKKSGGNALKLKEILDHCIKKLLIIKASLVRQVEHFDFWVKKNGLPERIGPPGEKGDTGPAGLSGVNGEKGFKGEPGPAGLEGAQGHPGRMGRKGDVGPTGDRGEPGDTGVPGHATYIRGQKGAVGDRGDQGPAGQNGPRGPPGDKGPKGIPGEVGNPGGQGFCLKDKHKQCRSHYDDESRPRGEPEPEPENIPNPGDFEAPDEKHIYYGVPAANKDLDDPKYCPSCDKNSDPEPGRFDDDD